MGLGSSKSSGNSQQQSVSDSSSSGSTSSNSSSSSSNQAYPGLVTSLQPTINTGTQSNSAIANLLGLNGASGSQDGLNAYLNSGNYNFTRDQGVSGITANKAASGLLGSGSALKAITNYSSNLAQTFLDKYIASLTGLTNSGLSAAQTLAGAGVVSNSNTSSNSTTGSTSHSIGSGTSTNGSSSFNASLG